MGGKVIYVIPLYPKYDFLNFTVSKLTFLVGDITEISEKWGEIWKNRPKMFEHISSSDWKVQNRHFIFVDAHITGLNT